MSKLGHWSQAKNWWKRCSPAQSASALCSNLYRVARVISWTARTVLRSVSPRTVPTVESSTPWPNSTFCSRTNWMTVSLVASSVVVSLSTSPLNCTWRCVSEKTLSVLCCAVVCNQDANNWNYICNRSVQIWFVCAGIAAFRLWGHNNRSKNMTA